MSPGPGISRSIWSWRHRLVSILIVLGSPLLLLTYADTPGGGGVCQNGDDGNCGSNQYHLLDLSHPWTQAFLATGAISLFPTLVLPFIPLTKSGSDGAVTVNQGLQKILLSFAAGGLLGEVFLHCIPHLLESAHHHDDHQHEHEDNLQVSLLIVMGFLAFFFAEKIVKLVVKDDDDEADKTLVNGHADTTSSSNSSTPVTKGGPNGGIITRSQRKKQQEEQAQHDERPPPSSGPAVHHHHHHHHHHHGVLASLKASGYLNIVVDLLHNFTDGIAIGTSYANGRGLALATTVSVFFHEIPHEIGDFAILVQSGLSMSNAIKTQFCTAVGAFLGTFVGLLSQRHEGLDKGLLSLTTGGFLYIATVSVIPDLLSGPTRPLQTALEFLGIVSGIAIMAIVALNEMDHDHPH